MSLTYYLRDLGSELVDAWSRAFAGVEAVHPGQGDIFAVKADALISPANSFGFMDGGIDRIYSQRLGWHVQERLQALLRRDYDSELPIGMAVMVETDSPDYPYLISAPTMRAPVDVSDTLNAYLAFRAALRLISRINHERPGTISSVLCPGLATGTGGLPAAVCAHQMYAAYEVVQGQRTPPANVNEALLEHYDLLRPL
ncbi:MAG TPA: macro domain-containing protein [Roseiflexaceae bacterium]|nr:macro domain-containing protein [Roseiflexaceae bacterium]